LVGKSSQTRRHFWENCWWARHYQWLKEVTWVGKLALKSDQFIDYGAYWDLSVVTEWKLGIFIRQEKQTTLTTNIHIHWGQGFIG
jgi:hypothetical protein